MKWDTDDSGYIDKDELMVVLMELSFNQEDAEKLVKQADRDGNGVIDYNEFVTWIMGRSAPMGAVVLLEDSSLNLRADASETIGSPTKRKGLPLEWSFGPESPGSVAVSPCLLLETQYTIACWIKLSSCDQPDWVPILGDKLESWGFTVGLQGGRIGIFDPRTGSGKISEEVALPVGSWVFVAVRGKCTTPTATAQGSTEFLVCSGVEGVQTAGTVNASIAGSVLGEIGSARQGLDGVASVAVWRRQLDNQELRSLFLHDALRLASITEEDAEWMKLNRRVLPPRAAADEETLVRRCREVETVDEPVTGTLDLCEMTLADADLKRILDIVDFSGPGGITTVRLRYNYLTEEGIIAYLVPFLATRETPIFIDLRDNPDISEEAEGPLLGALKADLGCRVEAKGTQLSEWAVTQLANITEKAASAVRAAANARAVEAFEAQQEGMEGKWKDQVDPPMARQDDGDLQLAVAVGIVDGVQEMPKKLLFKKFPKSKEDLKVLRTALAVGGRHFADRHGGMAFGWLWEDKLPPLGCGGGQLLAHFSYLSTSMFLRPPEDFGIRLRDKGEVWSSKKKPGCIGLHNAVEQRLCDVDKAIGKGFGKKALQLKLTNLTDQPLDVAVPAGTIFCHISWTHHQNLLVGRIARFQLGPGESRLEKIDAHCMNASCGCPNKDPFALTPFFVDDPKLLSSQSSVWDHFQGCFGKYTQEYLASIKKPKAKAK